MPITPTGTVVDASVTVDFREVDALLRKCDRAILHNKAGWKAASIPYYGYLSDEFEQGGLPVPWAPLAESTIRRKGGSPTQILVDSGVMRNSLTGPGHKGSYFRVGDGWLEIGTRIRYAGFHQEGTYRMKTRPFLNKHRPTLRLMVKEFMKVANRQIHS